MTLVIKNLQCELTNRSEVSLKKLNTNNNHSTGQPLPANDKNKNKNFIDRTHKYRNSMLIFIHVLLKFIKINQGAWSSLINSVDR